MLCMTCYTIIQSRIPATTRWENGFALACNRYTYDKRPFRVSNSGAVSQINTITRPINARDITALCYLRSIIMTIPRCPMRTPGVFGTFIVVWSRTSNGAFAFSECRFRAQTVFPSWTKNFFYYRFFLLVWGFIWRFSKLYLCIIIYIFVYLYIHLYIRIFVSKK